MTLVVSEKAAVASEPPERALGLPTALEADRSLIRFHPALPPKAASEPVARGASLPGRPLYSLSAKITFRRFALPEQLLEHRWGRLGVVLIGWMHHNRQK